MSERNITLLKPDYSARTRVMKQIAKRQEETRATVKRYDEGIAKVNDQITAALKKKAKALEEIDTEKIAKYNQEIAALENTRQELEEEKSKAAAGKIPADEINAMAEEVKAEGQSNLTKLEKDLREAMDKAEAIQKDLLLALRGYNETLSYLSSQTEGHSVSLIPGGQYVNIDRLAAEIRGRQYMEQYKGTV